MPGIVFNVSLHLQPFINSHISIAAPHDGTQIFFKGAVRGAIPCASFLLSECRNLESVTMRVPQVFLYNCFFPVVRL